MSQSPCARTATATSMPRHLGTQASGTAKAWQSMDDVTYSFGDFPRNGFFVTLDGSVWDVWVYIYPYSSTVYLMNLMGDGETTLSTTEFKDVIATENSLWVFNPGDIKSVSSDTQVEAGERITSRTPMCRHFGQPLTEGSFTRRVGLYRPLQYQARSRQSMIAVHPNSKTMNGIRLLRSNGSKPGISLMMDPYGT